MMTLQREDRFNAVTSSGAKSWITLGIFAALGCAATLRAQDTCPRRIAWVSSYPSGRLDPVTSSGQSDNSDLFVLDPGATTPRELKTERYIRMESSWSPDGRRLAVLSWGEEDTPILAKYRLGWDLEGAGGLPPHFMLYVVDVEDLSLHRLTDVPVFTFAWSPDGSRIAFLSQYQNPASYGRMYDPAARAALYVVDVADGARRPITLLKHGIGPPAWSPDGRHVAYEIFDGVPPADLDQAQYANREIHVVEVETLDDRRVTNDPAFDTIAIWSPDGGRLAFMRARVGPDMVEPDVEFWVATMSDGSERRLDLHAETEGMWWAPDGTRFYVMEGGGGKHVVRAMDVTTGEYMALPESAAPAVQDWPHRGRIDRDSRRTVWLEPVKRGRQVVRELDLQTGSIRDLATIPAAEDIAVDWSGCLTP
jgi:Tol biopolymer transport system component